MKRLALFLILVAGPAFAQQAPPPPEMQALQQMFAASQQQEFVLRVEVAKLRAENEKLKATQPKTADPAPGASK